ncbi:DNA helicase, partial [Tanacetum coccineum]
MRLTQPGMTEDEKVRVQNFLAWLLNIGDGNIGEPDETDTEDTFIVHIPDNLCIPDSDIVIIELINFIYDDITFQNPTPRDLQKKQHVYLSSDEATPHGNARGETKLLYPNEYLNSLKFARVIEARIITGTRISEKVFLPRISLINRDLQAPFIFKRKQFPVKLCYAMTITKSQGQSLERI